MHRIFRAFVASFALAGIVHAAPPKPASNPQDIAAITQVTKDFQAALKNKDGKALSSLMLNSNILFTTPLSDARTREVREKIDPNFDGVRQGGYGGFVQYIMNEKKPVEERFYDVKITQDGDLAWVMFDYEFVVDGKVENYGVEHWNMVKRDGKWKIYTVTWSMTMADAKK